MRSLLTRNAPHRERSGPHRVFAHNTAPFSPWSASYPTPLHAVWAGDPDWSNPGDGNAVSSWRNESGGGDPAQATGTKQPTYRASTAAFNGRPTVQFDGGDGLAVEVADDTQTLKALVVASLSGSGSSQQILGNSIDVNQCMVYASSVDEWAYYAGNSTNTGTAIDTDPHILEVYFNGASSTFDLDGSQIATNDVGAAGLDIFTIGARSDTTVAFITGHVAYAAWYDGAADLSGLVAALGDHYGITVA